ncbi:HAD-IB family hydrolase [Candidatus Protochlamydia phocaeensis]|uniref:HAD-IB family hydrolase n=1 Tax=Candidatus Protochlamydia phocaeensis TaxID=1414722 RepID=UPI000838F1F0|nr:HAD-IB family hydrolase [Candidatus Protochlamydia phocaeensis]
MSSSLPIIAAFDFDNTLTDRDSLLPFLFYQAGFFKAASRLMALTPSFIHFLFKTLSRQEIKEKILASFFKGMPYAELQKWGKKYASESLDAYLKPEAIERLRWHQRAGHRCVLISASLEFYLCPWAQRHGFDDVIASRLELDQAGCVTGRLQDLNCWGPEKSKRLLEKMGKKDKYVLYAYGDSRGDKELLALADFPFYRNFGGSKVPR